MSFKIRFATEQDLTQIQDIYNDEIQNGFATWNEQDQDIYYYQNWYRQHLIDHFPIFVVENELTQQIAGYAEYSTFRAISGFRQTVEHSVYIHPNFTRLGLGKALLQHLIQHASQHKIHVMIAAIDHENFASIKLHEYFGFKQTGYLPEVGQKFGSWRNLVLFQLNLNT